jgi:hypothetical protein
MMRNTIDPGSKGTSKVEILETSPQLKVNLLEQVATFLRVSFIGPAR